MPRIHDDDFEDAEDWHDDESDDEPTVPCPECGDPVLEIADRCPACGYWLTETDRQRSSRHAAMPTWVKLTAAVLLLAMLYGLATFMF
jgi:predicted amidophosphoribosyltransferase